MADDGVARHLTRQQGSMVQNLDNDCDGRTENLRSNGGAAQQMQGVLTPRPRARKVGMRCAQMRSSCLRGACAWIGVRAAGAIGLATSLFRCPSRAQALIIPPSWHPETCAWRMARRTWTRHRRHGGAQFQTTTIMFAHSLQRTRARHADPCAR